MTKKRRMFDIDLPEDDGPAPEVKSAGEGLRRGPMAEKAASTWPSC